MRSSCNYKPQREWKLEEIQKHRERRQGRPKKRHHQKRESKRGHQAAVACGAVTEIESGFQAQALQLSPAPRGQNRLFGRPLEGLTVCLECSQTMTVTANEHSSLSDLLIAIRFLASKQHRTLEHEVNIFCKICKQAARHWMIRPRMPPGKRLRSLHPSELRHDAVCHPHACAPCKKRRRK